MTYLPTTKYVKRLGAGSLVALMLAGFVYAPLFSQKATAQVGATATVEAPGPLLVGVAATAAAAGTTAAATATYSAGTAPRDILTSLLIITAKTALDSLTQSIVNWINSGFEGSPAFVSDLNRNLGNLADAVAEDFIRGLDQVVVNNTGISIRAPFQDQIARQLREEFYRTTSSYGFDARHPYTDCYGGRGFSLNGFFCQTQNPANNPYGRYQIARNELFKQLDGEAQNRIRELGWGRGFLSWRGPCGPNGTGGANSLGGNAASLSTRETNRSCPIRTPGTVIEDQLVNVLGSGVRQLELADNFNEIVSALMSQLLNQVLGSAGLSGVSAAQSGGGQSFVNSSANSAASITSQLFAKKISDVQAEVVKYRDSWQLLATNARAASQACSRDASKAAEANRIADLATAREREAAQILTTLTGIEAERAQLTSSGTTSSQAIDAVVRRFSDVISGLGTISSDTSGLSSQIAQLAASCR